MARPPNTDRIFNRREAVKSPITSESILDHIQAFQISGGRIEVLGNTRVLKKIDDDVPGTPPPPAPARRGSR